MPCPHFEPVSVALDPRHRGARLPLIEEYAGRCHARAEVFAAPASLRFECCNRGYARGVCPYFPEADQRSASRFEVVGRRDDGLDVLFVEEAAHAPVHWRKVTYWLATGEVQDVNECERAQIQAFSASYLKLGT